jgi:hypothetical protein
MSKYKYVICSWDSYPKILNCFNTLIECVLYLNSEGKIIESDFEIGDYSAGKRLNTCLAYQNVDLFKLLFANDINKIPSHGGEIYIYRVGIKENFNSIYEDLLQAYTRT